MTVILHVGIHKTASTFFQQHVFPKYSGITFVERATLANFRKYLLNADDFSFSVDAAKQLFFEDLEKKKGKKHLSVETSQYLISDEALYANPYMGAWDRKRNIKRLIRVFGPQLKVFIFIRHQFHLLNSIYLQYIKTGGSAPFHNFIRQEKYPIIFNANYFDYYKYLDFLAQALTLKQVKILLFEDFRKDKQKTIKEIADFIGSAPPSEHIETSKIINFSLNQRYVGIYRFLNSFCKSYKAPFNLIPFFFFMIYSKILLSLSRHFPGPKSNYSFLPDQEALIRESNRHLIANFPDIDIEKHQYPL